MEKPSFGEKNQKGILNDGNGILATVGGIVATFPVSGLAIAGATIVGGGLGYIATK